MQEALECSGSLGRPKGMLVDTIETRNLLLRPLAAADLSSLHAVIGNDPDMTWEKSSFSLDTTAQMLALRLKHYQEFGFGVWAVIDKVSDTLIGQAGLQVLGSSWQVEQNDLLGISRQSTVAQGGLPIELVVYVAKGRWGEGIGVEACTACLCYGFERLGLKEVIAITRVDNSGGRALARKLGFSFVREMVAYGFPVMFCALPREAFAVDCEFVRSYPSD